MSDRRMFSAREESVHEIFSENRYVVPYYQRPYSWLKDNAVAIWDDLYTAWQQEGFEGAGYFLGSVVLVKSLDREEIVDGQQRFITLQLLLSSIAHHLNNQDRRRKLTRYFISEEDEFAGTKAEMVVLPGNRYKPVFERILKNDLIGDFDGQVARRYLENYEVFSERCEKLSETELAEFGKYILQNSYIAALRAEDQLHALRIFAILNDRGIDLHPVDILKANILEKLSVSEYQKIKFAESWEEYEEQFDRKRFQDLIGHIRMTHIRARTQNPLHEDLLERFKTAKQAETFLKEELPSFVKAFDHILNTDDVNVRNLAEIGRRAGFKDWEAPALFVARKRSQLKSTYKQVILEMTGIVVMLAITKAPDGQRAGRFGRMISDLEKLLNGELKIGELESFKITRSEWQAFEGALSGDAYSIRGLRAALLWLEAISGDDDRSVESSEVTIEHVLPRKSGDEAFWLERFSETEWKENSNRLGNLLLVSGRSNTQMARKPFLEKMEYIEKKGGSSWIWTQDALHKPDWNFDIVKEREGRMIEKMKSRLNFE